MRTKFDILRSNRTEKCMEGPFPPSMTDLAPVLSIAEILRNPDVLLQKQRTMVYDNDNCDIYPEDNFGNDVQDVLEPYPAINKTSGPTEVDKYEESEPDKHSVEDTSAEKSSVSEKSKE